ncbi:MAG TPA: hypothetical protein VII59_04050 [Streptosporangiaceae bacterium]
MSSGGPGRDQHGVQPTADAVGPFVTPEVVIGLQVEAVLDGDEVEQAALGPLRQVYPVGRREETVRLGVLLAPCCRVPAGAIERDSQVQGACRGMRCWGHGELRSKRRRSYSSALPNGTTLSIISLDMIGNKRSRDPAAHRSPGPGYIVVTPR